VEKRVKKRHGFAFRLALAALLFALILELSKNTLFGWVLAALLFTAFAVLHAKVLATKGRGLRLAGWLVFLLLLAALLKLTEPPYRAIPAVEGRDPAVTGVVSVAQGDLTGVRSADGSVEVYAGIPYAKPPVGELRWAEPQEPESWEGIRACDTFAPMSMQQRNPVLVDSLMQIFGYHTFKVSLDDNYREPVSEDSLYLNIWKPAGEVENAPVLFFIHGGSLMTGQSYFTDYNGESFARQGVIVVNFAYRLNVFGYYADEELAAESPNGSTGNYGLLDQIAALRWVSENIEAFGGDPGNITIAGESAGASSVNALCVSPLAKGLFRRAIAESSGITAVEPYHTFRSMEDALTMGQRIRDEFHVSTSADLRQIDAAALVNTSYANNAMTVDGYAIVEQPYLTYERGENNEEALLNGFNGREADVFNLTLRATTGNYPELLAHVLGDQAPQAEALYPAATNREAKQNINRVLSAAWFAYSHHDWSRYLAAEGRPVYLYYFTRQNGGIGDWHSGEMIYAYGNLNSAPRNYGPDDAALSGAMQQYWINFIRTGDPNGPGLPAWPRFSEAPTRVLRFDWPIETEEDPFLALDGLIDAYQDELRGNTDMGD